MGQGNNQTIAVEPKQDNYLRCPRCQGILIDISINVKHENAPYEPIAKLIKCGNSHCGHIHKRFLLPGFSFSDHKSEEKIYVPSVSEKYGITKWMVAKCLKIARNVTAFTVTEFKEGKVHGFEKTDELDYNPDAYIEQEAVF